MTADGADQFLPGASLRSAATAVLDAADRDPRVLETLRGLYRGRHDVRDALCWTAHPGRLAPSGADDPSLGRAALARDAFSRAGRPESELALLALDRALLADAADLADAIAALRERERADQQGAAQHDAERNPESPSTDPQVPDGRPRRRIIVAVAAVVLAAAAAILLWPRPDGGVPLSTNAAGEPLPVFERAAAADDDPGVGLPLEFDRDTVRRLSPPGMNGREEEYLLYAARGTGDLVCLLVVPADERIASACVSLDEYWENGIRVSSNVLRMSRESLGSLVLVAHTVHWRPDGTIWFTSGSPDEAP